MRSLLVLAAIFTFVFLRYDELLPKSAVSNGASFISAGKASDTVPVLRVIDGDTIVVETSAGNETVRLIGIDTPEIVDPRKPVECFGREASEKAKTLLGGRRVRLEFDPSQGPKDKYGRTLAYVFLSDGTNFGKLMIEEGYAHEYTYRLPYRYQAAFKNAERAAREAERGLWAPGVCG